MTRPPEIGIGCAALSIRSPETGDDAVVEMLVHAYGAGVRYFDVAPLYGGGRGEVLLGEALAQVRGPATISTKVGYAGAIPYGGRQAPEDRRKDFSAAAIERGITDSLRRMNRDSVDIVFLHDPADRLDIIAREALPTLERLREQRLIGSIGVGTTNVVTANAALDRLPIETLLFAGRWTLIDRSGSDVLTRCRTMGVNVVAGGIFNSGLLAADEPARGGTFDYAPAPAPMLARATTAKRLCEAAGVPLKAAAVQFARRHPAVGCTLLGPRTRRELDELMALLAVPVPASLWEDLDRLEARADLS